MKTLTLDEVLAKITPLPWKDLPPFNVTQGEYDWNDYYGLHAANILPALVKAMQLLADKDGKFIGWETWEGVSIDKQLNDALTLARTIEIK